MSYLRHWNPWMAPNSDYGPEIDHSVCEMFLIGSLGCLPAYN